MKYRDTNLCYIIAEAGVNHNGSVDMAHRLIDVATEAGADAIKFQTFRAQKLVTKNVAKAPYQIENTGNSESQLSMLQKLELTESEYQELWVHCQRNKIDFLSTPFDVDSLHFLVNKIGIKLIKIGSGDLTNGLLLLRAAQTNLPVILSTGMSTLAEVEQALAVLAYGYVNSEDYSPSSAQFEIAYGSEQGQLALRERVSLLHCTTEYPASFDQVNLQCIDTLKAAFGLTVGFSDHTTGINITVAAVARGAKIVEKHFTLDRNLPGPDHCASLTPDELVSLVRGVREVELSLGSSIKFPQSEELNNRLVARRGLVASRLIKTGETFSLENLDVKRGGGVSAIYYWDWLGKTAERDYQPDEGVS